MKKQTAGEKLKIWFIKNKRDLPWRKTRDPYLIWISEVMLQQTTVQAVIPYFEKFKNRFPTVAALASAPLEEVLQAWAGLGYYSRARNLHKAAKALASLPRFPQKADELLALPGFGDYTSRAVSSIAFDEPVGVVDGNVIRILSRLYGQKWEWWKTINKKELQRKADEMVKGHPPSLINQGMMELGATICSPTSPACLLCPWMTICEARKNDLVQELPLKKPKRDNVIVHLKMSLVTCGSYLALRQEPSLPFLKDTLMPPTVFTPLNKKPKYYDFTHSITHYQIYVSVQKEHVKSRSPRYSWLHYDDITRINPSSLLQKALKAVSS